ncbi:MAG TPA: hypothetical protein CFH84_03330 [Sulfurimonas sp. UBA12504]|nr:MAG TPA: hypothetical protein CFH84_03330 [Sulfurimonas sp. UBA12504]
MKNIIIFILIFFNFIVLAQAETINECKTDIYYGNGVWNQPDDAEDGRIELQYLIDNNPELQAKYGEVKLQYNWGQGNMLDVLETYYQLREAGQVEDYQFFAVIYALTGANSTLTLSAVASQKLMEPFTRDWEQGNVDDSYKIYFEEINARKIKIL